MASRCLFTTLTSSSSRAMRPRRRRAHTYPLTLAHHVIVPARVAAPVSLEPRHRGERAQEAVTLLAAVVDHLRPVQQVFAALGTVSFFPRVDSSQATSGPHPERQT